MCFEHVVGCGYVHRVSVCVCVAQETMTTDVTLTSLEPYTLYTVQVRASNFYSESPTTLQPANIEYFRTSPGSQYHLSALQLTTTVIVIP